MKINPYLFYDSNCEAALKFYEDALGAKIEMMMRDGKTLPKIGPSPRNERRKSCTSGFRSMARC